MSGSLTTMVEYGFIFVLFATVIFAVRAGVRLFTQSPKKSESSGLIGGGPEPTRLEKTLLQVGEERDRARADLVRLSEIYMATLKKQVSFEETCFERDRALAKETRALRAYCEGLERALLFLGRKTGYEDEIVLPTLPESYVDDDVRDQEPEA